MDYDLERYPKITEIKNFMLHEGTSICTSDDDVTNYGHLVAMNLKIKKEQ